jgi:hypothetical protein
MRYLKFANIGDAEQRSRELWEDKLGRPKLAEDDTVYLYSFTVAETSDGGSYLLIEDEGALLTSEETASLENENYYQQWRQSHQPEEYQSDLAEENS